MFKDKKCFVKQTLIRVYSNQNNDDLRYLFWANKRKENSGIERI